MEGRRVASGEWGIARRKQLRIMNNLLASHWTILALRLMVGSIFIYAGMVKIEFPEAFADNIAMFQLIPNQGINLFVLGLPPFEVIIGFLLIMGWQVRAAAFAVLVLSVMFAAALSSALARGIIVDCGCFGSGIPSIAKTWLSLGRDLLLLLVAGWIYFLERRVKRFPAISSK